MEIGQLLLDPPLAHSGQSAQSGLDPVHLLVSRVNLYIKNRYNMVERVPAFVGESILDAINRMKVQSFGEQLCYGHDLTYRPHFRPHDNDSSGPVCASCRIVFEDNWFKRVHEETEGYNNVEELLLNSNVLDLKSNTRLACCVPVEAWMEGLTCYVDPDPNEGEELLLI